MELINLALGALAMSNEGKLPTDIKISGKTEQGFPILSSEDAKASSYLVVMNLGAKKKKRKK